MLRCLSAVLLRRKAVGKNSGLDNSIKNEHMEQLAKYRDEQLRKAPELRSLFIEMTGYCNEHCRHCGSNCGDFTEEGRLSGEELKAFLDDVKRDFGTEKTRLCITGGEPLLREDLFDIMEHAYTLGFNWGMTSNGTLIDDEVAAKLAKAGMRTISISLDGLKEYHEWFRQSPGSYEKTVNGIKALLRNGSFAHVQITTVVTHKNIRDLKKMYKEFSKIGVRSWRVINIEPIGRAKEQPELPLNSGEYKKLFEFINEYRYKGPMEVVYGCSHYLGEDLEREIRKWYFLCNAGVYVASVMYNGDITACLDIDRRPELVQGNIRTDSLKEVWENKFDIYRTDWRKCGPCQDCEHYRFCAGDSFHSWNFDKMEPNLCFKGILF